MAAKLRLAPMLIVIAAGLAACGDNEATQRKAFIEFLQSRIVAKPGVHVPKPTSEETASFGDYAQHYAVIADFNTALDQAVSKPLQQTIAAGAPRSLDEVVTKQGNRNDARRHGNIARRARPEARGGGHGACRLEAG
jgi:hypothetical protein